jgi:plastocyanin
MAERMPRKIPSALLVVLLALAGEPARAAAIHGDVSLSKGNGRAQRAGDAVVWIESVPEKVELRIVKGGRHWFWQKARAARPPANLLEVARRYDPRVVVVPAGEPVVIRNADKVWHGAFSVSKGSGFELGKRAPGSVDTVRFMRPGVIALRCDIHPQMSAYVVVTPNHAFARPDSAGHWRLPDVPSGTYVVHAWHPDRRETSRKVQMPARGDTLVSLGW